MVAVLNGYPNAPREYKVGLSQPRPVELPVASMRACARIDMIPVAAGHAALVPEMGSGGVVD